MKTTCLSAVLCLLAVSVAPGQWVETAIVLPDSLGGLSWTRALLYDSLNGTVYIGGEQGNLVVGVDPQTYRTRHRVRAGVDVRAFCENATNNKVYTADRVNNTVSVIDGATGILLRRVPVGLSPLALAWSPTTNRVYCVNDVSHSVSVIEGASDSVIATVGVGPYPYAVCINPVADKIYVANSNNNSVSVIDGGTNQVIKTVPVGGAPVDIVFNPLSDRVYTANFVSDNVSIIDAERDSVVATLQAFLSPRALCFNPTNNKVYCGCEDSGIGIVIDGAGDSIIGSPSMHYCTDLVYSLEGSRVYGVGRYGDVFSLDGAGDTLLARGGTGADFEAVCYDPVSNRVFAADNSEYGLGVFVYDGATLAELSQIRNEALPNALLHDPTSNRLYCANERCNALTVVDGATSTVVTNIPVGVNPSLLAIDTVDNKLYCANVGDNWRDDSTLSVVDCDGDTVTGTLVVGPYVSALAWNPVLNRLYCASQWSPDSSITVVDCRNDSVLARVATGAEPVALAVDNSGTRLFTANSDGRSVGIIDATCDSLLALVPLEGYATSMVHNPAKDVVYCGTQDSCLVHVVRGDPPGLVGSIDVGGGSIAHMCFVPYENKVYCTNTGLSRITVIDCNVDSVIKQIPASMYSDVLLCDTFNRYVYCSNSVQNAVSVIDADRDSVLAVIPMTNPVALAWNPVDLRIYAANHSTGTVTVIRDSLHVGIEESPQPQAASSKPGPTVVRGVLNLGVGSRQHTAYRAELLDISGRVILTLKPGANDVSRLAPGVYFVCSGPSAVSRQPSAVQKLVVTR
jgi:YVTN family beta-propeller protein